MDTSPRQYLSLRPPNGLIVVPIFNDRRKVFIGRRSSAFCLLETFFGSSTVSSTSTTSSVSCTFTSRFFSTASTLDTVSNSVQSLRAFSSFKCLLQLLFFEGLSGLKNSFGTALSSSKYIFVITPIDGAPFDFKKATYCCIPIPFLSLPNIEVAGVVVDTRYQGLLK